MQDNYFTQFNQAQVQKKHNFLKIHNWSLGTLKYCHIANSSLKGEIRLSTSDSEVMVPWWRVKTCSQISCHPATSCLPWRTQQLPVAGADEGAEHPNMTLTNDHLSKNGQELNSHCRRGRWLLKCFKNWKEAENKPLYYFSICKNYFYTLTINVFAY